MSVIRHWQYRPGDEVGGNAEEFLRLLGGPAWIRLVGEDRSRTRAITTLLHGNEPSGVRAVHRLLGEGCRPATDVLVLIASVDAALAPPGFANRMLPGRRDLNRCFADRGADPDACLAQAILGGLRAAEPECLIDLHNTSGAGPAYGVGTRADAAHRALTACFAGFYVLTDLRLGALMEAAEDDFPTVTIECGGARGALSDAVAMAGLKRLLSEKATPAGMAGADTVSVLRHPIRVRLANGVAVAYAWAPGGGRPLTLRADIDRFNSEPLPTTEPIGWAESLEAVTALDGTGRELRESLLEIRGGRLYARQPLRLFMATTSARIAVEDCLFYAMFSEEQRHE